MARNTTDVELVIKAKNEAEKTIEEIGKSFEKVMRDIGKGGSTDPLDRFTKSTEELANQQKRLDTIVKDAAAAQSTLGKAIRDQQRDYGRSENAIARLQRKLEGLQGAFEIGPLPQKQHKKIRDSIEETTAALARERTELDAVKNKYRESGTYVDDLIAKQKKLEQVSDQAIVQSSKLADEIKQTAAAQKQLLQITREQEKEYASTGRAVEGLSKRLTFLRGKLEFGNLSVDQLGKLAQQLDEVTVAAKKESEELSKLDDKYREAGVPIDKLEKDHNQLATSFTRVADAAAKMKVQLIQAGARTAANDAAREHAKVIRDQEKEYSRATAAVTKLEDKLTVLKKQLDFGDLSATQVTNVRAEIDRLTVALERENKQLDELKVAFRSAGAPINDLEREHEQLTSKVSRAKAELASMSQQLDRHAAATRRANDGLFGFGDSSRQALSFTQRLRGEVLALASAYVGLYGAIQGVQGALKTRQNFEAINSRLNILTDGDGEKSAALLEQLDGLAGRLGLEFEKLADQYSRFAIAAKQSNFTLDETNSVFQNVSEAVRGARLSADQTERVFYALEQMISKGTVNTEELRQQMGEALPGAFSIFAKSIGKSEAELAKLLEQGKISSRALIPFGEQLKKTFGPGILDAQESLNAEIGRFRNILTELRREFANDQFAREFTLVLKDLGAALSSPEVKQGIGVLRDGFIELGHLTVTVVENIDTLIVILKVLVTAWGASKVYGMAGALLSVSTSAKTAASALLVLRKALLSLTIVYAAYEGVKMLKEQYQDFEAVLLILVNSVKKIGVTVPAEFRILGQQIKKHFSGALAGILGFVDEILDGITNSVAGAIRKLADLSPVMRDQLNAVASEIEALSGKNNTLGKYFEDQAKVASKEIDKLKRQLKSDLDGLDSELNNVLDQMIALRQKPGSENKPSGFDSGAETEVEESEYLRSSTDDAKKAADSLAKIIRKFEADLADKSADSLFERQVAIEESYNEIFAKIDKLSKVETIPTADVERARELAAQLIQVRKEQEAIKYNQEQLAETEREITRITQARAAEIQLIEAERSAGMLSNLEAQQEINEVTDRYRQQLIDTVTAAREFAQVLGDTAAVAKFDAMLLGLKNVQKQLLITAQQVDQTFASSLVNAFDSFIQGTQSAGAAFRQFAADFLRQIAQMILQQIILNALQNSGFGGAVASAFPTNHTGGVVGYSSGSKVVNPMVFAGAVRYHSGGIAGLKPNEVPSILERGEEVLTKNDPRHRDNGGMDGSGEGGTQGVQIVNSIDSESVLSSAINKPGGRKQLLNFIRANKSSIRSMIG